MNNWYEGDDPILLMLDNSRITHESLLNVVEAYLPETPTTQAMKIRDYIKTAAVPALRSVGDKEQASELTRSISKMERTLSIADVKRYWLEVGKYYRNVYKNCRETV